MEPDLVAAKVALRKRVKAVRQTFDPGAGHVMAKHVLADWPLRAGQAVSAIWPLPGEIDTRPLLRALHHAGCTVLLPVTPRRGQALRFRIWGPGSAMIEERFGTRCPGPDAPEAVPSLLFVPLLAWDRAGNRLGYGGGYYDRTLAGLPGAVAVGIGYAAQEVDAVPAGEYDIPLSAVATEAGILRF